MANLNQKREFWLQHIDTWQQSGLSRSDYIKTHELSARYWNLIHYLKACLFSAIGGEINSKSSTGRPTASGFITGDWRRAGLTGLAVIHRIRL